MTQFHPADLRLTLDHDKALIAADKADPELVETFNVWLYDGARNIGFNIHPRASLGQMDCPVTIFLPDGKIARANAGSPGTFDDPMAPSSAYVEVRCITPMQHWRVTVTNAPVYLTTDDRHNAETLDSSASPVEHISMCVDYHAAAPCWINGALLPESRQTIREEPGQDLVSWWFANRLVSGFNPAAFRYDQLVEGSGTVSMGGQTWEFSGSGLRGHVRGIRRMAGMLGHNWSEGYSTEAKRGFGSTMFLRKGGGYMHSEGFLFEDGVMHPARILCTPHLDRDPQSRHSVAELACDTLGLRRIEITERRVFWWQLPSWGQHGEVRYGYRADAPVLMRQSIAEYRWDDGVVGYGLMERSG